VAISTAATVIASQAVISGAFSLARQAVQLGFWPRIRVVHTSGSNIGQVYIPFMNLALYIVTVILILAFRESGNLASAYGIAVATTMLITSILVLLIARVLWRVSFVIILIIGSLFIFMHLALFIANLFKLTSGGWVVVFLAVVVYLLITTWIIGRRVLQQRVFDYSLPIRQFVQSLAGEKAYRAPKTVVFLSGNSDYIPRAMLHNFKHNGILHTQNIVLSVQTAETPVVRSRDRSTVTDFGEGFFGVVLRFGFMETPDVPAALAKVQIPGVTNHPSQFSYFLGKQSLILSSRGTMWRWRKPLFLFLSRNALSASLFFHLPPNRVVELGEQIEF
jgi:KUP system potassium uptake protein